MLEAPPFRPELHIGEVAWKRRWQTACERADLIARVRLRQASGRPEVRAVAAEAPGLSHSTYRKWCRRFDVHGIEGLMGQQVGKAPQKVTAVVWQCIVAMREADPDVPVPRIVAVVAQRLHVQLSPTSVHRVLVVEGLNRQQGKHVAKPQPKERLFAGGVFLQLADQELGWSEAITETLVELRHDLPPSPTDPADETTGRDAQGHFTAAYNQAHHVKGDEALGPAFRSVAVRRAETDLTARRAAKEAPTTIRRKVQALLALPLLTDTNRAISLRDYRGGWGVAEFAGTLYHGETLDRFCRDLKYLGAAEPLIERHAAFWTAHAPAGQADTPAGVCVYIDGVSKPLWTGHFAKAGKVSSTGRVMPCIDQVLIHTGMGTPLFWQDFGGHGSLVTQTLPLLERLEAVVGNGWVADRLVVLDGEGHAAGLFKQFETQGRHFVTILRGTAIQQVDDVHDLGPWAPFRDGDEFAEGWADLPDSHEPKTPFRARIILVRRQSQRGFHALASNAPAAEFAASFLAEAYFRRWPAQELRFREFNQGVGFKQIHGYGKRLVQNVTVLTELDRLRAQQDRLIARMEKLRQQASVTRAERVAARRGCNVAKARRARQDGLVQEQLAAGQLDRPALAARIAVTQAERDRLAAAQAKVARLEACLAKQNAELQKLDARRPELQREIAKQESRKAIYQPDTDLDTIATAFKLGFALVCEHAVRTYFAGMRISLARFMSGILSLPGTRAFEGRYEHIRIRASRDPALMQEVEAACERVNARKIVRDGRIVKLSVDWKAPAQTL